MNAIETTLERSHQFGELLLERLGSVDSLSNHPRVEASASAADLSFEHAFALKLLFEAVAPSSAVALFRLQYEAMLRAAWLAYAATEVEVAKASASLTEESASAAKNLPNAKAMLEDLERKMTAEPGLRGLVQPLRELRDLNWTPMNAFVHAGLHPLARTAEGFPVELAINVIQMSNALMHMAARLLVRFTGDGELIAQVETVGGQFVDVLPVVTLAPTR